MLFPLFIFFQLLVLYLTHMNTDVQSSKYTNKLFFKKKLKVFMSNIYPDLILALNPSNIAFQFNKAYGEGFVYTQLIDNLCFK